MRGAAGMMLVTASLLTLPHLSSEALAAQAPATADAPYWAVVTGTTVNVRSGPSAQSAYAFGKLRNGDVVRVLREEFGWARVEPQGSPFAGAYGLVPADRRVTLTADGSSATVNARTELRAPNVDAGGAPDKSWKQIGTVEAGTTLAVSGTVAGERESVYKVALPANAEAWVNMQFLRKASDAEAAGARTATTAAAPTATTVAATPVTATPAPAVPAASGAHDPSLAETSPTTAPADTGSTIPSPADATTPQALSAPAIPPLLGQPVPNAATEAAPKSEPELGAPAPAPKPRFVSRRAALDDLERQFKTVRSQPDASAEFDALRAKYEELAEATESTGSVKGVANARAQQLRLLTETQYEMQSLERRKSEQDQNKQGIAKLILDIQRRADYTAIGVLNASAVYDGERLPELYRLTDPMTGATVAYVEPNADIPMGPMIGTLVGVKGGKEYDPALRISVIAPLAIDLLTTRQSPQVTKTESTRPVEEAGTITPSMTQVDGGPCPEDFEPASANETTP
jgi:SH3-like domain-containing protein